MVLRLYAADTDPIQPRLEQAVQDGLADAHFSAPRVILAEGDPDRLGRMFVVMERLPRSRISARRSPGSVRSRFSEALPAMAKSSLWRSRSDFTKSIRRRYLPQQPGVGIEMSHLTVRRHIEFVTASLEAFGSHRTRDALAWLSGNEPSPVDNPSIVHGDLWPANVLLQRRRLSGVVDWTMAGIGDPALDLGFTSARCWRCPAPLPPPPPIRQGIHTAGTNLARRIREGVPANN